MRRIPGTLWRLVLVALIAASLPSPAAQATKSRLWTTNGRGWLVVGDKVESYAFTQIYYFPPHGQGTGNVPNYRDPAWIAATNATIDAAARAGAGMAVVQIWWADMDRSPKRPADVGKALLFDPLDAVMEHAARKGVQICLMPMLHGFAPDWWKIENHFPHPEPYAQNSGCDFCETDSYGYAFNNPGMNNETVHRDYGAFLSAVTARYREHPALLGWVFGLGPTGEDHYGPSYIYVDGLVAGSKPLGRRPLLFTDFSPFFQRSFKAWLSQKYGSNEALRQAWGDPAASLEPFRMPAAAELVRDRNQFALAPFPDPAAERRPDPASALTAKGQDFFTFRNFMRERDTDFYAKLFKSLDPDHILIFNAFHRESALSHPLIDGILANPHPSFSTALFGEMDQYYSFVARTEAIVRSGKLAFIAAENHPERDPATGKWEKPAQLAYLTAFGKGVKCAGGMFGFASDVIDRDFDKRWLPSWFSPEALAVFANVAAYKPATDCRCQTVREVLDANRCLDGASRPAGCCFVRKAYYAYCPGAVKDPAWDAACANPPPPRPQNAQGPLQAPLAPTGTAGPTSGGCGDGACDQVERATGKCPQDCGQGAAQAAPNRPAVPSSGAGSCGDGRCDEVERSSGKCLQDCGQTGGAKR